TRRAEKGTHSSATKKSAARTDTSRPEEGTHRPRDVTHRPAIRTNASANVTTRSSRGRGRGRRRRTRERELEATHGDRGDDLAVLDELALRLVDEVTGDLVAGRDLTEGGDLELAARLGVRAARVEVAAR